MDATAAFSRIVVRAERGTIVDFVRAVFGFRIDVIQVKITRGFDDRAIGASISEAAAPSLPAGEFQKIFEHFLLRENTGGDFEGAFGEGECLWHFQIIRCCAFWKFIRSEDVGGIVKQDILANRFLTVDFDEFGFIELTFENRPCARVDITGDPATIETFGSDSDVGTACEAVKHGITFVGTGFDNALS